MLHAYFSIPCDSLVKPVVVDWNKVIVSFEVSNKRNNRQLLIKILNWNRLLCLLAVMKSFIIKLGSYSQWANVGCTDVKLRTTLFFVTDGLSLVTLFIISKADIVNEEHLNWHGGRRELLPFISFSSQLVVKFCVTFSQVMVNRHKVVELYWVKTHSTTDPEFEFLISMSRTWLETIWRATHKCCHQRYVLKKGDSYFRTL